MGMVNETIQMGLDSAKEDIESENYGKSNGVSSSGNADLEDFKREVLEGQKSFMEDMRSLMTDFMAVHSTNGVTSKDNEEPVVVKETPVVVEAPKVVLEETPVVAPVTAVVTPPVVEVPTAEPLPSLEGIDVDDLFDIEEEPEPKPQELSGQDILNNLLGGGGNSFNFGGIQ